MLPSAPPAAAGRPVWFGAFVFRWRRRAPLWWRTDTPSFRRCRARRLRPSGGRPFVSPFSVFFLCRLWSNVCFLYFFTSPPPFPLRPSLGLSPSTFLHPSDDGSPPSPFIITHISLLSSAPSTSLQPPRPAFSDHLSLSPTANVPISWRIHLVIITYVCLCVCCCPRWVGCCGRRRSDGDRRHASCLPQRAASSRRPKLRRRSRRRVCKIGALCVVLRSSTLTIRIYAALVATYR